ncbi:MAG: drug/metabolite transporter (DMT)-like permease [Chlamydiales bacterium]|jgi:drug/metabolite transporter (DMT)-like permease
MIDGRSATMNLLPILYSLASALAWGAGDFSGGVASKRGDTYLVVLISQALGGLLLAGLALLYSESLLRNVDLVYGAVAGIAGMVGLLALYTGLASGRMSVIAPLAAIVSVTPPVVVAALTDGVPGAMTIVGFGFVLIAVWLLSAGGGATGRIQGSELRCALIAGVAFSVYFVFIDRVSTGAIFVPLVAARVASVSLLALYLRLRPGSLARLQQGDRARGSLLAIIALAGLFDAAGNAFFALAVQAGRLDVAVILASLYPAGTVFLAWIFLKEPVTRLQWLGVLSALIALALIAI